MEDMSAALQESLKGVEMGSVVWIVRCMMDGADTSFPVAGWATPASVQFQIPKEQIEAVKLILFNQCTPIAQ